MSIQNKEAAPAPKWAMAIDTTRCVGCYACTIACRNQNSLEPGEYYNRIEEKELGTYPRFTRRFTPMQCQHCDHPPCVTVCPVGASYKRKDGVVTVNAKRCIGCKYCIAACPYNARIIRQKEGYVDKCSFCIQFVEKGEQPACVTTCPTGVRVFGNLADPDSEVSRLVLLKKTIKLGAYLNTKPSIYYITG